MKIAAVEEYVGSSKDKLHSFVNIANCFICS